MAAADQLRPLLFGLSQGFDKLVIEADEREQWNGEHDQEVENVEVYDLIGHVLGHIRHDSPRAGLVDCASRDGHLHYFVFEKAR